MSAPLLRLDRLIVSRGLAGRKEAQRLIRRGFVRFEGEVIKSPEHKLPNNVTLDVDGVISEPLPLCVAYHKPLHQLSTLRDPWGRAGLDYALPEAWRERLHPVGRLDADTTGLLLFSSEGALTQRLLHPRHEVPRAYLAAVNALPSDLEARLQAGVETSLGVFQARLLSAGPLEHPALISALEALGTQAGASAQVCVEVTEGKHRMVRRVLHNAGASVLALHRLSFGGVQLGELEEGAWRVLSDEELTALSARPV